MAPVSIRSHFEPSSAWNGRMRSGEFFPSPFLDMASLAMPTDNRNALEWCQFIYLSNSTLKMAIERIIAYFLTDIEIGAANSDDQLGDDEKNKWESFFESIGYLNFVKDMDRDKECYGNAFASIIVPFVRFLVCGNKSCRFNVTLKEAMNNDRFRFKFENLQFRATCPYCKYNGVWQLDDRRDGRPEKLILKRWSPHEIYIVNDELTGRSRYYWKIPDSYKAQVKQGKALVLENVSKEVLDAIRNNCSLFEFDDDVIYHMKEPTLGGIQNKGWGLSKIITHFRQCWYVQVLHRYNESIALDYVVPFRLITPQKSGSGDPMLHTNMGSFMGQVRSLLGRRKKDPAGWHTLPFPVDYQALGGEANQLAPKDLLDQGLETLLNAVGTPVELYKGTLQLQTAPVSLRLFEATNYHLVHQNNMLLKWFVRRVCELLSWEAIDARHKRVTHADDIQRQMAILQLMMSQMVSKTTALKSLGLDNRDEQRTIAEEIRDEQHIQAEIQEEMDTAAYGQQIAKGMPPGGGQPGMPMDPAMMGGGGMQVDPMTGQPMPGPVTGMIMSGNVPQTPEEMLAQAESLADQLLGMPEGQKDSELRALKDKNEVLHALVRSKLDQRRRSARQQGGSALLAQQYGTTPPMM